jgi:hypothetical protein
MTFVARTPSVTTEMMRQVKFIGIGAAPISTKITQEVIDKSEGVTIIKNGEAQPQTVSNTNNVIKQAMA